MKSRKLLKLALATFLLGVVNAGFSQENVQEAEFSYSPSGDGLYFKGTIQYKPRYIGEYLIQVGFKEVLVEGIEFEGTYYSENDIVGYNFPIIVNKGNIRVASATVWLRTFGNESYHNTKPAILNVYLQGYMDDLRLTQEEIKFLKGKNIDAKEWLSRFDHISNFRVEGEDNLGDGLEIKLKDAIRNQRLQKIAVEKAEEEARLKEEEESAAQEKLKEEEKQQSASKAPNNSQSIKKAKDGDKDIEEDREEEEIVTSNSALDPETHKRMMENDPRYRIETNKILYQSQGLDKQAATKMAYFEQQNYQVKKTGDQLSQAMGDIASSISKSISDSQNRKWQEKSDNLKLVKESHKVIVDEIKKTETEFDVQNKKQYYEINDPWYNGDYFKTIDQFEWLLQTYASRLFLSGSGYYINDNEFSGESFVVINQKIGNVENILNKILKIDVIQSIEKSANDLISKQGYLTNGRISYSSYSFSIGYDFETMRGVIINPKVIWLDGTVLEGKSMIEFNRKWKELVETKKYGSKYLFPFQGASKINRTYDQYDHNSIQKYLLLPAWVSDEIEFFTQNLASIRKNRNPEVSISENSFLKTNGKISLKNQAEIVSKKLMKQEFINSTIDPQSNMDIFFKSPVVWCGNFDGAKNRHTLYYTCLGNKPWIHFTQEFAKIASENESFPITFSYSFFGSNYYLYLDAINKDYSQVRFSGFYSESHWMSIEATLNRIFGKHESKVANETSWNGSFGNVRLIKEGNYQFLYLPNRFSQQDNHNQDGYEPVLDKAEISPTYSGGMQAFYNYVQQTLKYPDQAKKENRQGTVYVQFVVEMDGSITNISVMNSLGSGCDEESIRILSNCPNWIPGEQDGKKVRVKMFVPITFTLK